MFTPRSPWTPTRHHRCLLQPALRSHHLESDLSQHRIVKLQQQVTAIQKELKASQKVLEQQRVQQAAQLEQLHAILHGGVSTNQVHQAKLQDLRNQVAEQQRKHRQQQAAHKAQVPQFLALHDKQVMQIDCLQAQLNAKNQKEKKQWSSSHKTTVL